MELDAVIEITAENVESGINGVDVDHTKYNHFEYSVPVLVKNIEIITRESKKYAQKLDFVLRSLSGAVMEIENDC